MRGLIRNSDGTILLDGVLYVKANTRTKEKAFAEIIEGLDRRPSLKAFSGAIFWVKDGVCYFKYQMSEFCVYCCDAKVWDVIKMEFGLNYSEVQDFMIEMVDKHFDIQGVSVCPIDEIIFE